MHIKQEYVYRFQALQELHPQLNHFAFHQSLVVYVVYRPEKHSPIELTKPNINVYLLFLPSFHPLFIRRSGHIINANNNNHNDNHQPHQSLEMGLFRINVCFVWTHAVSLCRKPSIARRLHVNCPQITHSNGFESNRPDNKCFDFKSIVCIYYLD